MRPNGATISRVRLAAGVIVVDAAAVAAAAASDDDGEKWFVHTSAALLQGLLFGHRLMTNAEMLSTGGKSTDGTGR